MFGLHKPLNPLDAGITIGVSPSPEAVGTVKQCKTARPPHIKAYTSGQIKTCRVECCNMNEKLHIATSIISNL